ncbi:MAG: hypothetical protein A2X12_07465 [Bacteroidetes bacterium GWE2_29_8]|nr:MAG: hypothetical protein A2X12_07465 [Bacteroidetes bacterium GWE2_29_8]
MSYLLIIFSIFLFSIKCFSQDTEKEKSLNKLQKVYNYLDSYYYDSVDYQAITSAAIISVLKELDPHSTYLSKEVLETAEESLKGVFSGVGIQYFIYKDTVFIISVTKGGPSENAGIRAGDRIIKVGEEIAFGNNINNDFISKMLKGNKDEEVKISIYRKSVDKLIDYTISRNHIKISSLDACYIARPNIAYIRINNFAKNTISEIENGLKEIKEKEDFNSIILDLRGNTGGYLSTAVDLASEFLDDNQLIVYTEGLNAKRNDYKASKNGFLKTGKLIVLIDEVTASASEIVAGAIQDWDRGLIIGRRTYGKGLVQRPFYLNDGSAVRLTTARYYTPSGRCIQKSFDNGSEEYFKDIGKRYAHGEFTNRDSIKMDDSLSYKTILNNRTVFGRGGIMPDIFIPYDTNQNNQLYKKLWSNNLFNKYYIYMVDGKDVYYTYSYNEMDSLLDKNTILQEFKDYAIKENIEIDNNLWDTAEKYIYRDLKSVILKNLFGTVAYYKISNEFQDEFLKSIEVIEKDDFSKFGIIYNK